MSHLADVLSAASESVVQEWTTRLAKLPDVPPATETGLRDHVPELIQEMCAALRAGVVPKDSPTARAHGIQREMLGFDLDLLVAEHGLLRDVIFDFVEERGLTLSLGEVRILTGLMTVSSALGVDAYVRREAHLRRQREEKTLAEGRSLQEVLDALPVLVSFVTSEERYALVNKAYETWFEKRREDVVGRTVREIVGEAAYRQLQPFVRRGLAGERFDFEQHDVPYRTGTRDIRVSFIPRHDDNGDVSGYVTLLTDITSTRRQADERERLLAAEREAHARTEFLLAVAAAIGERLDPHAVIQRLVDVIVPTRGNVASVWLRQADGQMYRQVHAPAREELEGAESSRGASEAISRILVSGETVVIPDYEEWARAENAPDAWRVARAVGSRSVLFVPIPRVSREEHAVAVLGVSRAEPGAFSRVDVELFETTARLVGIALENARLFEETESLRKTAERATDEKDRFLAHVSHDLRNPLGAILGWSSMLRTSTNTDQIRRGAEVIERNAKAQVQLIDDLLDVSRIGSGKLTLQLSVEDVRVAVDTALDPARTAAQAKEVTLTAIIDEDAGTATVDPDRFRQIVWNLASNAVKFTPSGGNVRVTVTRAEPHLRIVITDTGPGIAPELLPRIFHRFEQASPDPQRKGGLGLGLTIVRHLVDLHGGTISVESVPGRGATFIVELPILPRHAERPSAAALSRAPLRGKRLLVVDDQEDVRELIGEILENAGANVTLAASADEAMSAFRRARPDAIVSDIGMPNKDGYELVREIRALPDGVPAVALTAFVQPKDRADALAAGFDVHLTKPVNADRLVDVITALLE